MEAQQIKALISRRKSAAIDPAAVESALQQAVASQAKQEALQRTLQAVGITAGAGMAARGLFGLGKQVNRAVRGPTKTVPTQHMLEVPVEYIDEPEKRSSESPLGDGSAFGSFLRGDQASTWSGVPWAIPAMTAGAGAGMYGGWKLTDWVLDARRKQELKAQLNQARREYREALLGKAASDGEETVSTQLHDELEALYKDANDALGTMTGLYGTAAGGVGLLGFLAAYNWAKKRQRRSLLEKAQKRRFRERQMSQPLPLEAVPVRLERPKMPAPPTTQAAPELSF